MSREHGPWRGGEAMVVGPKTALSSEYCLGCGEAAHTTHRIALEREHENYRSYRRFLGILATMFAPPYRLKLSLPFCLKCPRPTRLRRFADRVARQAPLLGACFGSIALGLAVRALGYNAAGIGLFYLALLFGLFALRILVSERPPLRYGVDGELLPRGRVRLTNVHPRLLDGLPPCPPLLDPNDDDLDYIPDLDEV